MFESSEFNAFSEAARWIENPEFDGFSVSRFMCEFKVRKDLNSARLYIAAAGFFQAYVNDKKTDSDYYKPVLTDFLPREQLYLANEFNSGRKKLSYYTYDIKEFLSTNGNRLDILLGTGYFYDVEKTPLDPSFAYGTPKLLFEIHLNYGESTEIISSGEDCFVRSENRRSLLFGGDFIDYSASEKKSVKAQLASTYTGDLILPETAADKVIKEYLPEEPEFLYDGGRRYDFGVNHSGGLYFKIRGKRGTRVTVRYAEIKNKEGALNFFAGAWIGYDKGAKPVCSITQKDEFILSGGVDEFSPLFCFHCYRYAEFSYDAPVEIFQIKSLFICAPLVRNGWYCLGNEELNRFSEAYAHTQLCVSHCGVPIDCPHREKLPYTGDGWLTLESALYLYNAETFYSKWLNDILEAQGKSGFVPYTAPYLGGGGGYAWGNAIAEVPMLLYRYTGKKEYITRAVSGVLKWAEYYKKRSGIDGTVCGTEESWLLGDWASPEYNCFDVVFMSTLCRFRTLTLAAEMCSIVGDTENEKRIRIESERLRVQINTKFYDSVTHNYLSGKQGENVVPVAFGITEPEALPFVIENIKKLYSEELQGRLDTGMMCTPLLFEVLIKHGMKDLAFRLLTRKEYPSFIDMIKGETTLREYFTEQTPGCTVNGKHIKGGKEISHCHTILGAIAALMYKHIAGMDLSRLYLGKIVFSPKFCKLLLKASAEKQLPQGEAKISYENDGRKLYVKITVPQGLDGICILEDIQGAVCVKGEREFSVEAKDGCAEIKLCEGEWLIDAYMTA